MEVPIRLLEIIWIAVYKSFTVVAMNFGFETYPSSRSFFAFF